jgi:hypothetical protein
MTEKPSGTQGSRTSPRTTRETIDIMSIAVADGDISAPDAFGLMNQMADSDRYLRLPKSAEELRSR